METKINKLLLLVFLVLLNCIPFNEARAQEDIFNIKELSDIYVTSVSKKPEIQFKAASSVTVLTQEEIRRSGATSIAEALRYVPGLNVAQIDANKYAISARGFNRQYSNKLLVLIDGRSVYTPLFSGVFWDIQDTVLADIERIEIIKGPGATIWGSNAVNGVINIITKKAQNTQGNHISLIYGDYEDGTIEARHGSKINNDVFYRAFFKLVSRDEFESVNTGNGNDDDSQQRRFGFRFDGSPNTSKSWRLSGDFYDGRLSQTQNFPGLMSPTVVTAVDGDETYHGFNVLGSYENQGADSYQRFQSYIDYNQRTSKNFLEQNIFTFDFNYQNIFNVNKKNQVTVGGGFRHIRDELEGIGVNDNPPYIDYFPKDFSGSIYNLYIQNEFKVVPNLFHLIFGSKFEHHYFTDLEIQPNIRFSYYPSEDQTVWGAVSKAARTPTRGERGISVVASSLPGGFVRLSGDPVNYESEDLVAYELGHRYKTSEKLTFDTSVFYHDYNNLRTFEPGPSPFPSTGTIANLITQNMGFGESYGLEIETKYTPLKNWTLTGSYSLIKLALHVDKSSLDTSISDEEIKTPQQQFSLLSRLNIGDNLEFDSNLAYVDELEAFDIPSYVRLDIRIGWKPLEGVEVSLTGQNLLDPSHPEFQPFLYTSPAEVGRSVFVKLNLNF